jgi:putative endonuclease
MYFEPYEHPTAAIAREKQIKGWLRAKKVSLIETHNPTWSDLAAGWFESAGRKNKRQAGPSLRSG